MAPEAPSKPYPIYNTTFTLHRLSPLYTTSSAPLSNTSLETFAHRLRDILAGEVLRGVRVGLAAEEDVLARVGALQSVKWRLLPEEAGWNTDTPDDTMMEDTTMDLDIAGRSSRGWVVSIEYEKITYKALMLRDSSSQDMDTSTKGEDGFEHLPLMMLKMPAALKETFIDFLASTFDCRISGLHLGSAYLMDVFERYLVDLTFSPEEDATMNPSISARILTNVIKEVVVSLSFDLPGNSSALKTVDITIARDDVSGMLAAGRKIEDKDKGKGNFFSALGVYVQKHLALDLGHEKVRVVRLACSAFVLGAEGKLKLLELNAGMGDDEGGQSRATRRLVNGLIELARGGKLAGHLS